MKKMKAINIFSFISVAAMLPFSFCGSEAARQETTSATGKGFAVVELFTSEGCSSCPPADEVMIKLSREFPDHVYFLGYHVDYWDYIGWKDEFAGTEYTKRQNRYAEVFSLTSIYTPQVIVNGEKELVGSRENQLRTAIQEDLKGQVSSVIELNAKKTNEESITVSYKITGSENIILNIALVQLKASSNVKRGENKGHQLNHINVVRELKTIAITKNVNDPVGLKIPPGLPAKDLKVIAFIQNDKNMKITGATETAIQ